MNSVEGAFGALLPTFLFHIQEIPQGALLLQGGCVKLNYVLKYKLCFTLSDR